MTTNEMPEDLSPEDQAHWRECRRIFGAAFPPKLDPLGDHHRPPPDLPPDELAALYQRMLAEGLLDRCRQYREDQQAWEDLGQSAGLLFEFDEGKRRRLPKAVPQTVAGSADAKRIAALYRARLKADEDERKRIRRGQEMLKRAGIE